MTNSPSVQYCPHCSEEIDAGCTTCPACGQSWDTEELPAGVEKVSLSFGFPRIFRYWRGRLSILFLFVAGLAGLGYWIFQGQQARPVELKEEIPSPLGNLTSVLYTREGKHLAAGNANGEVVLWNLITDRKKTLEKLTDDSILTLAVSPDGFLVGGSAENQLLGWQLSSSRTEVVPDFPAPLTAIAIHPQRFEIVVGLSDGSLYMRNAEGLSTLQSPHEGSIKQARYHPRGDLLVTADSEGMLVWWETEKWKKIETAAAHETEIGGLAFSQDGRLLASGDWNGRIKIWDVSIRKARDLLLQPDAVSGLVFSRSHLVTGSWDGQLRFWSVDDSILVRQVETAGVVRALDASPDRETIATVSDQPRVQLWQVPAP